MDWVRFRVINGYDVILNMSTAIPIKLKIEMWQFTPTHNSMRQRVAKNRKLQFEV